MFFTPALAMGVQTSRGEDMNCSSGSVTSADFSMFFAPQLAMGAPGASGLSCAGTPGCN
jgi:hypothetical protein